MSALRYRLIGLAFILLSFAAQDWVSAQPGASATACPQRRSNEPCIQVITFARNPGNGRCCVFPTPCAVPPGFETVSQEECEGGEI